MAGLPGLGTVFYNGFLFPGAVITGARGRPVRDTTGRVIKYTIYNITIEFIAHSGVDEYVPPRIDPSTGGNYTAKMPSTLSTDEGMANLRVLLSQSGKPFVFVNKGLGVNFEINTGSPDSTQDLAFGPMPQVLVWEPVGANQAVRIVWTVEVAISDCFGVDSGGNPIPFKLNPNIAQITEFTYTTDHAIDTHGLTTRTLTGFIEFMGLRSGSTQAFVADQVRRFINVPIPIGYQRISQSWPMNAARNRLLFNIVDRQHPSDNALPEGAVNINVRQAVRSTGRRVVGDPKFWNVTITGTISVAKDTPRWRCWDAFLQIISSRRQAVIDARQTLPGQDSAARERVGKPFLITTSLSIEEDLYGRSMSFSISWKLYTTIENLFRSSGLLLEVSDDWADYASSMSNAWSAGGTSKLYFNKTDNVIVTICDRASQRMLRMPGSSNILLDHGIQEKKLITKCNVLPEDSWLEWCPAADLLPGYNTVDHMVLGGRDTFRQTEFSASTRTGNPLAESTGGGFVQPVYQHRTSSYPVVRFYGWAKRLEFEVPEVHLKQYGEVGVTPLSIPAPWHKSFEMNRTMDGCKVWGASWVRYYRLNDRPRGQAVVTEPAKPLINTGEL